MNEEQLIAKRKRLMAEANKITGLLKSMRYKAKGIPSSKICPRCRTEKELSEFADIKSGYCKNCKAKYCLEYKINNWEKIYRWRKRWIKENKDKVLEYYKNGQRKYRDKYPEKIKAQSAAQRMRAVLIKDKCEQCDSNISLQLHHPDYSKPLKVITLCAKCHWKETLANNKHFSRREA